MRVLRPLLAAAVLLAAPLASVAAQAQTKIAIGKVVGGNGLHIPSYVALSRGFFKEEGLDARFVQLTGKAQVTAGLSGNLDFTPIPSGGAQAALNGAAIEYIVGQSLSSQWVFVTRKDIDKVEQLKGKTIGYGRVGAADYDEGATTLSRFFKLEVGRDYKVISFQGEPERIAALLNKDIDGALFSAAHAAAAVNAGLHIIMSTSDYLQRVGGSFWSTKDYAAKNPETVKHFIRAIAKGVMAFRTDKTGSIAAMKEHLGIDDEKQLAVLWDELHTNTFGAELPKDLFREIFESRRIDMIKEKEWPADKPLPDPEQFLNRPLLESTLKEVGYTPTPMAKLK